MSRVRAIDGNGDWTFGKGQNNYLTKNAAVGQQIRCRLFEFLGDCYFNLAAGIDWFGYLGGKDQLGLNLAVSAIILNTINVTGIRQLSIQLGEVTRIITIQYQVQTTFSVLSGTFQYDASGIV